MTSGHDVDPEDADAAIRDRLSRLRSLTGRVDGLAISSPSSLRYFLGWLPTHPAFLVGSSDGLTLVVADDEPVERFRPHGTVATYRAYHSGHLIHSEVAARRLLERLYEGGHKGRWLVELDNLSVAAAQAIGRVELLNIEPDIREWRSEKGLDELTALRFAHRLLDTAFGEVRDRVEVGATELDLYIAFERSLRRSDLETLSVRCSISSGPRTSWPDAKMSNRALQAGDLVLVDLYPCINGYVADCTRSFVVGDPTALQVERYSVVLRTLEATEGELMPGQSAKAIDEAIRRRLGPYSASMTHHSGHGVGIEGWEEPWIGAESTRVLAKGNVVALEPGLYVDGWGGIRLESNYVITSSGASRLDGFPRELM